MKTSLETSAIDRALSFDPIAEAERLSGGKHWSQFSDKENALALTLTQIHGQSKAAILRESHDTYWGIEWDTFKEKLTNSGFKCGLCYDLKWRGNTEEAIIFYNAENGIVLFATSFSNKHSINGGTAYAEVKAKTPESHQDIMMNISTGGFVSGSDGVFETSWDVREGMFRHVERLEQYADFQSKWIDGKRFLWFVDFNEDDVDGYDYRAITNQKIALLPDEARAILSREE